ncbi:MAG: PrsW family glutamic-type intramembrane protease [Ignavibacteria bacterium]|nr:PrsW family glutamic-type intramembrane protease [Ignavibacteria bacterium]
MTWLAYYLRKDAHPEPKRMILKIFLWGALITIPVFFVQIGLKFLLDKTNIDPLVYDLIYWFLIISFSEEFFKYLVIRVKVINSPHLDEPLDIMLYMVIAALGFAAIENVLYLFVPAGQMSFNQLIDRTLIIDFIRFIGATFLHTLCSAVVGYSLAISFCEVKTKNISLVLGLLTATLLHGLYDFSIMTLDGYIKFAIPVIVILTLAFLVFSSFESLKKMKSICKIT